MHIRIIKEKKINLSREKQGKMPVIENGRKI
jgi:hypothetical protein